MQRQPCVQLFDSCTCYLLHATCYMLHACFPLGLKLLKIQQILRFQNASHYLRELYSLPASVAASAAAAGTHDVCAMGRKYL